MKSPANIIILLSGYGSNLQSIIDATESQQINARISAVISNNPQAFGLKRARQHGIECRLIDHRDFDSRSAFEQALLQAARHFQPDYIVLAGFMRILGSALIQAYPNQILNIHPSILPNYPGLNTHQRALEDHAQEHGVSIHIVTTALDSGPILLRGRYLIENGDTIATLRQKGQQLEHRMYPKLLEWLCNGDLEIKQKTILFRQQPLLRPIDF